MPERIAALPRSSGGLPVPFVAQWEGEDLMRIAPCRYAEGHPAIFPADPDDYRRGRPVFGVMEPSRQREACRSIICQVCALPLGPMSDRYEGQEPLWLVDMLHTPKTLPGRRLALEPWVCDDCLLYALQVCPGLVRPSSRLERTQILYPEFLLRNVLAVWTANVFGVTVLPGGNLKGRPGCIGYLKIEPLRFLRIRAAHVLSYTPATIREMIRSEAPA